MSSTDLIAINVKLKADLEAQKKENLKNEKLIALYESNQIFQRNVYDDKKSDADFWKKEWTTSDKKVKTLEGQLDVAAAMHKYSSQEKDYLVKYIVFSAERKDIFLDENHPLKNLVKGEKPTAWGKLDTQTIKIIMDELASNARFTLNIFDKVMPLLKARDAEKKARDAEKKARDAEKKARDAAQKEAQKRGPPGSADMTDDLSTPPKRNKTKGRGATAQGEVEADTTQVEVETTAQGEVEADTTQGEADTTAQGEVEADTTQGEADTTQVEVETTAQGEADGADIGDSTL